jgi:hypothetical protein
MPFQKGRTKTGGRQKGGLNKSPSDRRVVRTAAQKAAQDGLTPLEYMLKVLRNPRTAPDRRDRVAGMAAPYLHAKLAVIDSTIRAEVSVTALTEDERRARARALIAEAFRERTPVTVDGEYKVIAGRDVAADVDEKANGDAAEEREG